MDDEHVLALIEAVHGAHGNAVHGFAANAAIFDDVGQSSVLPAQIAEANSRTLCAIAVLVLAENAPTEDLRPLTEHRVDHVPDFDGRRTPSASRSHSAAISR